MDPMPIEGQSPCRANATWVAMHAKIMPAATDGEAWVGDRAQRQSRLWELSVDLLGILDANGFFDSTNPDGSHLRGLARAVAERGSHHLHGRRVERTALGPRRL